MVNAVWNLSSLYASNEDFLRDFDKAKMCLKNLLKYKNKLEKNDKKIILGYLKEEQSFSMLLEKLAVYARCKSDDDGKDVTNIKNYQEITDFFSEVNQSLAFSKTEMAKLSDEFLTEIKNDIEFKDFDRYIEFVMRNKKHTLSENEEIMLASLSSFCDSDEVYSNLCDIEMYHGFYINEKGEKVELSNGNYASNLKSPLQDIRKIVMQNFLAEYAKLNLTISGLYLSHVKYVNFLAKKRGFESALDMFCYDEEVSPKIIRKNIDNVSKKIDLIKDYFELKKNYLKLNEFYTSDISANFMFTKEDMSYEYAVECVKNSLLPLGDDYVKMFEVAIKEGWIDAYPRKNKASGGYTISAYGTHPYILLNYDNTASWASAIAHEFGHAMHSYYSDNSQPYAKAGYTLFVAEVASLTNEILFNYYMLQKESEKNKKIQIISELLQVFYLNVYDASLLAEFEIFVHENLQNGSSLTANDLNQKYLELNDKYFGNKVVLTENYVYNWSRKSHIFRDYYLYKYSTGFISASTIAKRLIDDKTGEYLNKYKNFLRIGGSLDPISSLKVADIDILSDETYDVAFDLFKEYLEKLKSLTKEN